METHGFEGTSTHEHCQLVAHMMNLEPNDHATHDIVSHWDVPGPSRNDQQRSHHYVFLTYRHIKNGQGILEDPDTSKRRVLVAKSVPSSGAIDTSRMLRLFGTQKPARFFQTMLCCCVKSQNLTTPHLLVGDRFREYYRLQMASKSEEHMGMLQKCL